MSPQGRYYAHIVQGGRSQPPVRGRLNQIQCLNQDQLLRRYSHVCMCFVTARTLTSTGSQRKTGCLTSSIDEQRSSRGRITPNLARGVVG